MCTPRSVLLEDSDDDAGERCAARWVAPASPCQVGGWAGRRSPDTGGLGYVDCQSLSYVLPDGRALFDDASFRVGDGTKTALVGANGTGKTTLLRLIAGDLAAAATGRSRATAGSG